MRITNDSIRTRNALGLVEIHLELMTAAHAKSMDLKFLSVFSPQCDGFKLFELREKVLDEVSPFVDFLIDRQGLPALWTLGDNDLCPPFIHFFDDPICVERFVCKHGVERYPFNQRGDTNGVIAVAGQ